MTSDYARHVKEFDGTIDPDFWRQPHGVTIEHDLLKFLYVPDHVETYIIAQIARQVYRYQVDNISTREQITHGVMITIEPFQPLDSATQEALIAEGERVLRFIEDDAESYSVTFAS